MLTQLQLRTEVYNALIADTALTNIIGTRLFWLSRPTSEDTYPLLIYKIFDSPADYAFGLIPAISEEFTFQIDVYTDPNDITNMDTIIERIKVIMTTIGYRNTSSPIEFLESTINKIIRPTRWERINV